MRASRCEPKGHLALISMRHSHDNLGVREEILVEDKRQRSSHWLLKVPKATVQMDFINLTVVYQQWLKQLMKEPHSSVGNQSSQDGWFLYLPKSRLQPGWAFIRKFLRIIESQNESGCLQNPGLCGYRSEVPGLLYLGTSLWPWRPPMFLPNPQNCFSFLVLHTSSPHFQWREFLW